MFSEIERQRMWQTAVNQLRVELDDRRRHNEESERIRRNQAVCTQGEAPTGTESSKEVAGMEDDLVGSSIVH